MVNFLTFDCLINAIIYEKATCTCIDFNLFKSWPLANSGSKWNENLLGKIIFKMFFTRSSVMVCVTCITMQAYRYNGNSLLKDYQSNNGRSKSNVKFNIGIYWGK